MNWVIEGYYWQESSNRDEQLDAEYTCIYHHVNYCIRGFFFLILKRKG